MQQRNQLLKYVLDIESIIAELEEIVSLHQNDYLQFSSNFIAVRAVERDLMIIGEAVNNILKVDSSIPISGAKHIIGLRNLIVHAYDAIDPAALWKILQVDLPVLKIEIAALKE